MKEEDIYESPDYVRGFVDALEMVVSNFRKKQIEDAKSTKKGCGNETKYWHGWDKSNKTYYLCGESDDGKNIFYCDECQKSTKNAPTQENDMGMNNSVTLSNPENIHDKIKEQLK